MRVYLANSKDFTLRLIHTARTNSGRIPSGVSATLEYINHQYYFKVKPKQSSTRINGKNILNEIIISGSDDFRKSNGCDVKENLRGN